MTTTYQAIRSCAERHGHIGYPVVISAIIRGERIGPRWKARGEVTIQDYNNRLCRSHAATYAHLQAAAITLMTARHDIVRSLCPTSKHRDGRTDCMATIAGSNIRSSCVRVEALVPVISSVLNYCRTPPRRALGLIRPRLHAVPMTHSTTRRLH